MIAAAVCMYSSSSVHDSSSSVYSSSRPLTSPLLHPAPPQTKQKHALHYCMKKKLHRIMEDRYSTMNRL
jgi:hypothetical protein